MAKFIGIDYGTRRVGIAVSDETGTLAFPKSVLTNDRGLLARVVELSSAERASAFVLGESKDFRGADNPVARDAAAFGRDLERESGFPVHLQQEFLTSVEARRLDADPERRDAHAAAVILQRYLDAHRSA